ncbi:MAG: sigma-54 interaction domain-containing protein, partial [Planctomycetota bacterium]
MFNRAAEQVFGYEAAAILHQPLDPLLSQPFCKMLDEALRDGKQQPDQQYLWASEGLTAVRSDGQSFPVEATLSSFDWAGERLHTLILRDVDARQRAETRIKQLEAENLGLQHQLATDGRYDEIISRSSSMWKALSQVERVAITDATVLLQGETGTGKELFVRTIHRRSRRKGQVLIVVNCAALPKELVESELFGHEKGAFTGAAQLKKGRFELADKGTIFLDEIGELSLEAQSKLLRVLQESEIQRVGSERTFKVDVRVVAATHRDLKQMVQEGTFREDLYYRLSVFPLSIPPLREHKSDIPLLVDHFVGQFAHKFGKTLRGFNAAGMHRLMQYHWPGNIRELQNVVERAAILA